MEENSSGINEMGSNPRDTSHNFGAEIRVPEDVKISSVVEISEVPSHNGLENLENRDVPPETGSMNPVNGKTESMEKEVSGYTGHLEDEDSGTPDQAKKSKAKPKIPLTSSRVLRSKSQENPKAPEPSDTGKQDSANREKKSEGRKKKQIKKKSVNEFSRTKARLGYLLHRIKYEQSLIDAYSSEGWKGQSLEKLKPEKELQRAKSHILSYKLRIRELFQHLESSLAVGKLPESLFDSKGEIDSEDIFCAKCGSKELPLDNDIILCDGACERGFHQFCLEPPLLKEDIPLGDESWLCPGCDCKAYCIDMLRDYQGINVSITDNWEKVFPEAAASASGKKLDDNFASSSKDSEDDDYDPDKPDTVEKVEGEKSSSDESNYFSASDDLVASPNNENFVELPSDNSEDDDFDPTVPDPDKQVKQDSSTSDFTSDSEDLRALLDDATAPGYDPEHISPSSDNNQPCKSSEEENSKVGRMQRQSLKAELSYLMESIDEPLSGKRQRERLDYEKLHNETYGNSSSDSSDEDYEDTIASKRKKINREKTELISHNETPITKSEMDTKDENQKESRHLPNRTPKVNADGSAKESPTTVDSVSTNTTKSAPKRLGEAATQRLYQSFNENQYPEKAVQEKLANELGLSTKQVSKWFENARWSYRHKPRMENLAANSSGENSETHQSRKRKR